MTIVELLGLGSFSALVANAAFYPLDLLRTLLLVQNGTNPHPVSEICKTIFKSEGFRGFFRGFGLSMAYIAPYVGVNIALSDYLMPNIHSSLRDEFSPFKWNFICGVVASICTHTLLYPLDTVRRLAQLQSSAALNTIKHRPLSSTREIVHHVWKHGKVMGFYGGLTISWFKSIPTIGFTMYLHTEMRKLQSKYME